MPLSETVLRDFLGGVGLGTWIVAHETPAGTDPLGPDAALVFALSPLVGSPLTTSAKFAVVALSPLTGRLCDALASSHFAIAAKRVGVDALAITGACDEPSIVFVDGMGTDEPRVEWRPAGELWGLSAREAEDRIRAEHGKEWQVASIGPAGERLIPFATLSHDGRHAGRGGLGAVLGSKRIKAVAVRGDRRTPLADPSATMAIARRLSALSLGPATEKYRELGTVANLLTFNRFEALPTRNFQSGRFEGAERLAAEDLAPARRVARASCAACTIGCEHIYASGKRRGPARIRVALRPRPALRRRRSGDRPPRGVGVRRGGAGHDLDRGDDRLPDGLRRARMDRRPGRTERASPPVRRRRGLARRHRGHRRPRRHRASCWRWGAARAAERIGGEAPGLAPHVKGLELPGYDPRALHTMALGLAVGTRGADHNRSGAYEADFSERVDRRGGGPASAPPAIETEDRAAVMDSMILCKFLRGVFADFYAESAEMLAAVTGWDVDADELRTVARRVVNARKCVNSREGWTLARTPSPRGSSPTPRRPPAPRSCRATGSTR